MATLNKGLRANTGADVVDRRLEFTFKFQTETPFNASCESPPVRDPRTLRLAGHQSNSLETIFSTPFKPGVCHNFALTVDWTSKCVVTC